MNCICPKNWHISTWLGIVLILFICGAFTYIYIMYESENQRIPYIAFLLMLLATIIYMFLAGKNNIPDQKLIDGAWLAVIVLCIAPLCASDCFCYKDHHITKFIIDYCTIIASTISIIFVIYTLILQRKQLSESNSLTRQMRDNEVLKIIDEFLSPEIQIYRNRSSSLRDKLRFDKEATIAGLKFAFERQIRDDYYNSKEWKKFKKTPLYEEYAAFTRLMRFFDMISHAPLSETTAQSIHFYYVWWSSFLIEVTQIFNDVWEDVPSSKRYPSFKPNWVATTERLNAKLASFGLPLQ
ncbi:MAG: hypothetical protein K2L06_06015 [Alistipes sp.]|nr:hypothetical protein [Alistipes sp.]